MKQRIVFLAVFAAAAGGALYGIGPEFFFGTKPQGQAVYLHYYNKENDTDARGRIRCSPASVFAVQRRVPGKMPIRETLDLLLKGDLKDKEKAAGFDTEFPHPDFRLKRLRLDPASGRLTLTFTEVPGFTSGGSCRTGLLAAQIRRTARQFAEVRQVRILPETLFQP